MKDGGFRKTYTGINIQFPISQLILSGKKTIETRTYPIPQKYIGQEMLLIETPGKTGKFKSRIVAVVRFENCFQYNTKDEFYKDFRLHRVDELSPWAWTDEKKKWGWAIKVLKVIRPSIEIEKRIGIQYTKNIQLPVNQTGEFKLS